MIAGRYLVRLRWSATKLEASRLGHSVIRAPVCQTGGPGSYTGDLVHSESAITRGNQSNVNQNRVTRIGMRIKAPRHENT